LAPTFAKATVGKQDERRDDTTTTLLTIDEKRISSPANA
jgi:hypothetical protein